MWGLLVEGTAGRDDVTAISRHYPPGLPDEDVLTIAREESACSDRR